MRLLSLGVGDAFSALYYSSCFALEADGQWLLIDCPHPIRKIVREASQSAGIKLDVGDFSALVLTHLHADHASGVEDLAFFTFFAMQRKLTTFCHPDVSARMWDGYLAASMDQLLLGPNGPVAKKTLDDFFTIAPLSETSAVQYGPFSIECRRTIHHIPTFALRITAGGRTLGYSCDTAYDDSLIQWLSSADLIVHETNLGLHTPYEKLAALPEDLRKKMRLIHFTDAFDAGASVIEALRQGAMYGV